LPWDIKQIFDKSVQLRQLDVCEMFGFMVFCDFKGHMSVFKLNEFNQILSDSNGENSQIKSKVHCKERRLEAVSGCHLYAIGKQLINKNLKLLAACGRKLYLIEYVNSANSQTNVCNSCASLMNNSSVSNQLALVGLPSIQAATSISSSNSCQNLPLSNDMINANANNNNNNYNPSNMIPSNVNANNDITKMFVVKREINCSDVPCLINLVDSFSGENYILVAYKNKCELFSEKQGECLRQFQFNQLSNIRSIVELYDNHKLEILVTYNCKCLRLFFNFRFKP
jgi:hypothetical protein